MVVGGSLGVSDNATIGGTVVVGTATVSGLLKAPQIRITGTTATDKIQVQNADGTMVAEFCNDYRCLFNGNTTVLGDAHISGNLTMGGFLASKPWVGFLVTTDGAGAATISKHVGYNTTGIIVSQTDNSIYTFTMPAHPKGSEYLLMLSPYATSSTNPANWPTGYGQTSTIVSPTFEMQSQVQLP